MKLYVTGKLGLLLMAVIAGLCACGGKDGLTEKEASKRAAWVLQEMGLTEEEPEQVFLEYRDNSYALQGEEKDSGRSFRGYWRIDCSFAEGEDYQVWLNAADGQVMNVFCMPVDWFDEEKEAGDFILEEKGEYTEKGILEKARLFCERAGYEVAEIETELFDGVLQDSILLQNPQSEGGRTRWPVQFYQVTVNYADGGSGTVALCADDLSLLAAWCVPYQ